MRNLNSSLAMIERRERTLLDRLNRLNLKVNSPSAYFSQIINEMDSKISLAKDARREAQHIVRTQRLEQTKTGIDKMKRQMGLLEVEIDSLHMPIVDEFKAILLK